MIDVVVCGMSCVVRALLMRLDLLFAFSGRQEPIDCRGCSLEVVVVETSTHVVDF